MTAETRPPAHKRPLGVGPGVIAGVIGGVTSSLRATSYDSLFWLTISRRVFGSGDLLYFDVLDNKGPLLYLIVGTVDVLPGSERFAFSALFALATGLLAGGVFRVLASRGCARQWTLLTVAISVGTAVALSAFTVTTEFLGLVFLVHALGTRNSWVKVALAFCAMLIDIRAFLVAAVLLASWWRTHRLRPAHVAAFVFVTTIAATLTLVVPELRLALVESSLGNRDAGEMGRVALQGFSALLPTAMLVTVSRSRLSTDLVLLVAAGILIGAGSLLPFAHYWVYLALPLLVAEFRRTSVTPVVVAACALTLIPLFAVGIQEARVDARYQEYVGDTPSEVASLIRPNDRVFVWSALPHLRVQYASRTVDFSPTAVYLTWNVPNRARLLEDFAERLGSATVVVVEASLDPKAVMPEVQGAQTLVSERVASSTCSRTAGRAVVYRFDGTC